MKFERFLLLYTFLKVYNISFISGNMTTAATITTPATHTTTKTTIINNEAVNTTVATASTIDNNDPVTSSFVTLKTIVPDFVGPAPITFAVNTLTNKYDIISVVNSDINFDCTVIRTSKKLSITWLKDGVNVKEHNFRFYYDNLTDKFLLPFNHLLMSDNGRYQCVVSEGSMNITKIFVLKVIEKPGNNKLQLISPRKRDERFEVEVKNITLTCHVTGDTDIPKYYQWEYYKLISRDHLTPNQRTWISEEGTEYLVKTLKKDQCSYSLELKNLQIADSGIYECIVFNERGFVKSSTNITIVEKLKDKKTAEETHKSKNLTIIVGVTCACVLLLIIIVTPCIWRRLKSRSKSRRKRTHSYHYKSSLSQDPQTTM